jgi:hypothetical protein
MSDYYIVLQGGKKMYFPSHKDAEKWVKSQPGYPQHRYHIYPKEWEIVSRDEKKIFGKPEGYKRGKSRRK